MPQDLTLFAGRNGPMTEEDANNLASHQGPIDALLEREMVDIRRYFTEAVEQARRIGTGEPNDTEKKLLYYLAEGLEYRIREVVRKVELTLA